ncbi:MAG: ATP-binding protein, partial [Acidobacteriota bacterium]|nr:ATP-binding protein [Acidobacteriota bacterium]
SERSQGLTAEFEDGDATLRRASEPFYVVPVVLNVKGEDLMWIDKRNREFDADRERHEADWRELGVQAGPFAGAQFFSPADPKSEEHAPYVAGCDAQSYYWSPRDVFEAEAFRYLFSDEDVSSPAMMACVYDIAARMTDTQGKLRPEMPQTWDNLLDWVRNQPQTDADRMHNTGTWRAIYRRLFDILMEGRGIFPPDAREGRPLNIKRAQTSPPQVVDIHGLPASLQRFVVAMILKQAVEARTGRDATPNLRYLIVLDELNRFAPRGGTDPITRLLERVATEMRSQGVILLGAQQMASQVSTKVIEMASVRVLGRTGPAELQDRVWQSLDKPTRQQAAFLGIEQKLVTQPTFRKPMLVRVPHPAWAMKYEHIPPRRLDRANLPNV